MVYYNPEENRNILFERINTTLIHEDEQDFTGESTESLLQDMGVVCSLILNTNKLNDLQDEYGNNLTMIAVKKHNFAFFNFMMEEPKQDFSLTNNVGDNLLHILAYEATDPEISVDTKNYIETRIISCLSKISGSRYHDDKQLAILTAKNSEGVTFADALINADLENAYKEFSNYLEQDLGIITLSYNSKYEGMEPLEEVLYESEEDEEDDEDEDEEIEVLDKNSEIIVVYPDEEIEEAVESLSSAHEDRELVVVGEGYFISNEYNA